MAQRSAPSGRLAVDPHGDVVREPDLRLSTIDDHYGDLTSTARELLTLGCSTKGIRRVLSEALALGPFRN
jgi:hypothetical protein